MVCPKCKVEYPEGYTKCPDCGENLIDSSTASQKRRGNVFFRFGETTAENAITLLFFIGSLPLLFSAVLFGRYLYLNNTYLKSIRFMQDGQLVYSEIQAQDTTLGVLGGFAFFIVAVLIWKVLCELLIIIFRALETYIQKNRVQ